MGNLSNVLIIVFCLATVFFIAQMGILSINPTSTNTLGFTCQDTIMQQYGECSTSDLNGFKLNSSSGIAVEGLPTADTGTPSGVDVVVTSVANVFNSVGNWLKQALGLQYLQVAMNTPKLILNAAFSGVPGGGLFIWAIGGMLIALIVFFFIDWMKGAFA